MEAKNEMLEVLTSLLKELMNNNENLEDVQMSMMEKLIKKGYEIDKINEILEEIFNVMNIKEDNNQPHTTNIKMRVMQPTELENLTDNAKGYLFSLKERGVLTEEKFEDIINRIETSFMEVDKDQLKVILEQEGIENDRTVL
ncbi:MAG: DUF494 family protein [Fusobacteriota bacterium]